MRLFYLFILLTIVSFSCVSPGKTKYMQGNKDLHDQDFSRKEYAYKVKPHDVLLITITSTNPKISEFFQLKQDGDKPSLKNHIISDSGFIYLPILDSIYVSGLSVMEIQNLLQTKIRNHVTDATVVVKLVNLHITILGEVNKPGIISIDADQITLFQAFALAGDMTDVGNKKKVKLIRKDNGKSKVVILDLSKSDIIESEYFYLQPNDVLYVEPLNAKYFRQNVSQVTLLVSIGSFLLILLTLLNRS